VRDSSEIYEGDEIEIGLTFEKSRTPATAQVEAESICPLAEPGSPQHTLRLFIPMLSPKSPLTYTFACTVYRRGLHEFPPARLTCRAPFGLFAQRRESASGERALVYPEVRKLRSLELLDRRLAPQMPRQHAGTGYEALGVRPYRTGDSPRHIHWRSVARHGQLISKEFADETQPGLTLALDLFQHDYTPSDDKHTPFEWAVKCAASIGDYAQRRGYPLHLLADSDALALPPMPISESGLLQYLARIEPTGKQRLSGMIANQATQAFMAVVLPWPDLTALDALIEVHGRRTELLCILIDPATFPHGGPSGAPLYDAIRAAGIEARLVHFGEDWIQQITPDTIPLAQTEASR
jgi:uncharacterized protein (DUF58 family)